MARWTEPEALQVAERVRDRLAPHLQVHVPTTSTPWPHLQIRVPPIILGFHVDTARGEEGVEEAITDALITIDRLEARRNEVFLAGGTPPTHFSGNVLPRKDNKIWFLGVMWFADGKTKHLAVALRDR